MNRLQDATAARFALGAWVRALEAKKRLESDPYRTLLSVIGAQLETHGEHIALMNESDKLTYRELFDRSAGYGCWALARGIPAGGVVCLLMPNCPEYAVIWLGITQIGCVVALLNTNLEGDALAHSIRAAGSDHIIVADSLVASVRAITNRLPAKINIWVHGRGDSGDLPRIDIGSAGRSNAWPDIVKTHMPARDSRALLIYTSGTTGLPKAANVSHARILEWSYWFAAMMDARPEDRLYDCLPMYHSTGGVVAIGAMLISGGSVLTRDRFSASRFWDDVINGDCTIFQYIGELCRYLVQSPPHPRETEHKLRLCCGNGMRGDVWERLQQRFAIPHILEFYASTEGNVSLYNCEEKPGAIGRIPPFLAHRFPMALVRSDPDTGELLRDTAGFCIRCATDEPGEAISPILINGEATTHQFDGYTDPEASARKVAANVFTQGDQWFRTGDLMRKDKAGFFYFVDRIGDTFRWKGENVATDEVAAVVTGCPGVMHAVVYGVAIPGAEGRAGMAAVTIDDRFNFTELCEHLRANLPDYARPLFVRVCRDIPMTGTFKLTKGRLAQEGLATSFIGDPVWFYDRKRQAFVEYDATVKRMICSGELRL
jgi:fatty-acyl-CoA synthase